MVRGRFNRKVHLYERASETRSLAAGTESRIVGPPGQVRFRALRELESAFHPNAKVCLIGKCSRGCTGPGRGRRRGRSGGQIR
jgi:hypothetical protein